MIARGREWKVKRAVRKRDGNACAECGMTQEKCRALYGRGLHVHRLEMGTPYTEEGCTLLCKRCHSLAHGKAEPVIPADHAPLMPATTPRQFRLTEAELARLDDLGRQWGGPVRPLTRTQVIREMIRRAAAETPNRTRSKKGR